MTERILELACGMTHPSEEEQALLETLCHASEAAWAARLKSGVSAETCAEAFLCAAAMTAAADFAMSRNSEGVESFTAGEISIRHSGCAEGKTQADALRKTAERLMAPYAEPESFALKGVRG